MKTYSFSMKSEVAVEAESLQDALNQITEAIHADNEAVEEQVTIREEIASSAEVVKLLSEEESDNI